MSVRDWIRSIRARMSPPVGPVIIISTPWGNVTEGARRQAELNMAADPELRARCEAAMVLQMGDFEEAMKEMRRRYPAAYPKDERKGILR